MEHTVDTFLTHLNHWHWGLLAVGLVILEMIVPLSFFLWLGLASGIVGGLLFFFPAMGWKAEFLLFFGLFLVSVGISRILQRRQPTLTSPPPTRRSILNRRASQYVGRIFTLIQPIQNGVGFIQVDNIPWKITGQNMAAGEKVKVIGFEGAVLSVESIDV